MENGIFSCKTGDFEVFMLVEAEREGSTNILPSVTEEILKKYIPPQGFMHGCNAFLVKSQGSNILIDCGTGMDDIIINKMGSLGVEPGDLDTVLITHLHGDHIGSLLKGGFVNFLNAKLYLDAKEKEFFTNTSRNNTASKTLDSYAPRVKTFAASPLGSSYKEIVPGISPIANYGHTPGHTAYLIESKGEKLLIAGDFLHIALIQFPHPEFSATYDNDKEEAAASRREILDYAAKNKIPLGAMHLSYPGIVNVIASGSGYSFEALE